MPSLVASFALGLLGSSRLAELVAFHPTVAAGPFGHAGPKCFVILEVELVAKVAEQAETAGSSSVEASWLAYHLPSLGAGSLD